MKLNDNFKAIMNFDAIQLITNAWFDTNLIHQLTTSLPTITGPYPLLVKILVKILVNILLTYFAN